MKVQGIRDCSVLSPKRDISIIPPPYKAQCCQGFLPCPVPTIVKAERNHTEVYISYKLIGPLAQTY